MRTLALDRPGDDTSSTPRPLKRKGTTLFTPQQLFDDVGSAADVLGHASFLERARVERDHERETPARLALAAYVVVRLVDRLVGGLESAEAREGFGWQLEAVRRHLADLPADAPETAHLTGVVEAVSPVGRPAPGLRLSLTAYAYFLEHEARLAESLDVLALSARTHGDRIPPGDFAAIALFAGRLNRLQAQWNSANASYALAEEAAETVKDSVGVLRSRLGRCAVLRGQGNLPASRALAVAVLSSAQQESLREVQAMAWADLGAVLVLQGLPSESVQAKYRAFQLTEDSLQRMRVLGDLGVGLLEIGAYEAARIAFEIVASSNTSFLVRTNAVLELMELESAVGNRMAFERRRAEAEEAFERMAPSMAADFRYKSGVGLARFGRMARARDALSAGLALAETHQLNAWYFRFERVLANLEQSVACVDREPEHAPASTLPSLSAVEEVAVGLREYALMTS